MLYTDSLAPPLFTCACDDGRAGATSVRLTGELDLATAGHLERALCDAQVEASQVVLDLRGLTFMDCCGMHVILDAAKRARRTEHRLTVVRGPAQVDRVFTLTGAADTIDMCAEAR